MNRYIEHDRRNCSMRTMTETDLRLHYGSNVIGTILQDGSVSLSHGIDIYLDCCYPSPATIVDGEVKDALQGMRFRANRL